MITHTILYRFSPTVPKSLQAEFFTDMRAALTATGMVRDFTVQEHRALPIDEGSRGMAATDVVQFRAQDLQTLERMHHHPRIARFITAWRGRIDYESSYANHEEVGSHDDFIWWRSVAQGYRRSRLLLTALEVDLFDHLGTQAADAAQIADELGLDPSATEIICDTLVAYGLLRKQDDRYFNTDAGARFLVRTSPEYKGEILRHDSLRWGDWTHLLRTWQTGEAAVPRPDSPSPPTPEQLRAYILGMENISRELAVRMAAELPLEGRRSLLDLGAGPGNYSLAFALAHPDQSVTHFDLAEVSEIAQDFMADRVPPNLRFLGGDFRTDSFGDGYDFIWASQMWHTLGAEDVRKLLAACHHALTPGGVLAIHEFLLDDTRTSPDYAAVFGVHALVTTGSARTYTVGELTSWLREVGLVVEETIETGWPSRIMIARKTEGHP
ncbi:methyltransferase [Streptomyces sp. NPDC001139]